MKRFKLKYALRCHDQPYIGGGRLVRPCLDPPVVTVNSRGALPFSAHLLRLG